jgi:hypothetical protein
MSTRGGVRQNSGRKGKFDYIIGGKRYGSLKAASEGEGVSVQSIHNWCGDSRKGRPDCQKVLKGSVMPEQNIPDEVNEFKGALEYLQAVTIGKVKPDSLRIAAAKAVLPYEEPKRRAKPESKSPKKLKQAEDKAIEKQRQADFEAKAKIIRAEFATKGDIRQ